MGTWGNESKYLRAVGAIGRVLRDSYGKASGMCVRESVCVWVRLFVCVCMCVYCVCACVCSKCLKAVGAIGRGLRGSYGKASGMCVWERGRKWVCESASVCVCVYIVCVHVYVANIWGLFELLGGCSVTVMAKHLVCERERVCVCVCASVLCICLWQFYFFGLPTMRRLPKLFRQFWKIALFLQGSLVRKKTLFKEPTNCCRPI